MKDGHPQEPGRRLNRLRGRGKAAAGAVGSDGIVLAPPLLDQHGRLRQRVEDLPVQQLVPELAVEALVVAVLPRAARLDKEHLDAHAPQPQPHELRAELRSVVRPQILGRPVSDEQIGQHLEHVVRADLASHHDRQALPRVLVQHCQQLQRTPVVRPRVICRDAGARHLYILAPPILQPESSWRSHYLGGPEASASLCLS